jgi:preprotein translocase subunit SecE
MLRTGLYKRSQGRITRQVTFAALAIGVAVAAWRLKDSLAGWVPGFHFGLSTTALGYFLQYGVPGLLLLLGCWVCYRLVNVPSFADFLIAVEAEMNKVSWPSRTELFRASLVVLVMIIAIVVLLYGIDFFWQLILTRIISFFA